MQASKIKPKHVYAVKRDDVLTRFLVASVITERIDITGSPHDYKSRITGNFLRDSGERSGAPEDERVALKPEQILGPFEEHAELVERQRQEKAAADAARAAREAALDRLWSLLYQATGQIADEDASRWRQPFRKSSTGVEIAGDGVEPLIKALEALLAK